MIDYVIGGWSQKTGDLPPSQFSYTMYGMITNLQGLTSGLPTSSGWSPASTPKPDVAGKVLWTYGGGGAVPDNMPATQSDIQAIISATDTQDWDGIDVDDESNMDINNIIATMKQLKQEQKETSYTFRAGWNYNNQNASSAGATTNKNIQQIVAADVCDRFPLMCYATSMWSMDDIVANVGPAIERTIAHVGDPKKVFLALTPVGLNQENLAYFLNQVTTNDIGGLFVWNFPILKDADLVTICEQLGIS